MEKKEYLSFYTQQMMLTILKYKINETNVSDIIASYLCTGEDELKNILDESLPILLGNLTKEGYYYVFFNYPNKLIYYSDYDGEICLENVNLISVNFTLSCMSTKLNLAIWKKGEEIDSC